MPALGVRQGVSPPALEARLTLEVRVVDRARRPSTCGVRKFGRTSQNIRFAGKTEFTHPQPSPERRLRLVSFHPPHHIHRRDRLGGLIHEYAPAA